MKERRRLLVLGAGAVLLAAGALATRPERITRENCDRIQNGMTRAEVEAILGPPGEYGSSPEVESVVYFHSGHGYFLGRFGGHRYSPKSCEFAEWLGETICVNVGYDDSGRVAESDCEPVERHKLSPLDSLLWRAKRQWRTWSPE